MVVVDSKNLEEYLGIPIEKKIVKEHDNSNHHKHNQEKRYNRNKQKQAFRRELMQR